MSYKKSNESSEDPDYTTRAAIPVEGRIQPHRETKPTPLSVATNETQSDVPIDSPNNSGDLDEDSFGEKFSSPLHFFEEIIQSPLEPNSNPSEMGTTPEELAALFQSKLDEMNKRLEKERSDSNLKIENLRQQLAYRDNELKNFEAAQRKLAARDAEIKELTDRQLRLENSLDNYEDLNKKLSDLKKASDELSSDFMKNLNFDSSSDDPTPSFHLKDVAKIIKHVVTQSDSPSTSNNSKMLNIKSTVGILNPPDVDSKKNFKEWYDNLQTFFCFNNLQVDLSVNFDELPGTDQEKSKKALHLIKLVVTGSTWDEINSTTNSIDALKVLRNIYEPKTGSSRIEANRRAHQTFYKSGDDMHKHLAALKGAFSDLSRHGSPMTEIQKFDALIASLPPDMEQSKSMYGAWPEADRNFEKVAENLREGYERFLLAEKQHESIGVNFSEARLARNVKDRLGAYKSDNFRGKSFSKYRSPSKSEKYGSQSRDRRNLIA